MNIKKDIKNKKVTNKWFQIKSHKQKVKVIS